MWKHPIPPPRNPGQNSAYLSKAYECDLANRIFVHVRSVNPKSCRLMRCNDGISE